MVPRVRAPCVFPSKKKTRFKPLVRKWYRLVSALWFPLCRLSYLRWSRLSFHPKRSALMIGADMAEVAKAFTHKQEKRPIAPASHSRRVRREAQYTPAALAGRQEHRVGFVCTASLPRATRSCASHGRGATTSQATDKVFVQHVRHQGSSWSRAHRDATPLAQQQRVAIPHRQDY